MNRFDVQDFLEMYIKKIVKNPDSVSTSVSSGDRCDYLISINVSNEDIGKVIGKDGKMIGALKNIVSAYKAKHNVSYELVVSSANSTYNPDS